MPRTSPRTIADYRRWLKEGIEAISSIPELDLPNFEDAAHTVREAGEIALRLGMPGLYRKCRVRPPMLAIDVAKALLAECLAACPEEKPEPPALLSVEEVANMLGVSARTVWRRRSAGEMPEPIQVGGLTKWRREDIEGFING